MQWSDDAIVLSVRRHGETSAIASLLTRDHGRHPGLVRGGGGKRLRGVLQPGNEVRASWRGRLAEHLGTYAVEPMRARAAALMADAGRLAVLASATAVAEAALPEREPHGAVYDAMLSLLDALAEPESAADIWGAVYVRFELGLLAELGFGLDLSKCAATGVTEGLAYVSPRTGHAVSAAAAAPYVDRLLVLPGFLAGVRDAPASGDDLRNGLRLTGFFLERQIFLPHGVREPAARLRLVERFARETTTSGDILTQ